MNGFCPCCRGRISITLLSDGKVELRKRSVMPKTTVASVATIASASPRKLTQEPELSGACCPECGGPLRFQEGCESCMCGYSRC